MADLLRLERLDGVVDNCEFPQVSISGNTSSYSLGQASYTTLYDFPYSHIFRGDITKILGKHTLKMGGTWEKLFVTFAVVLVAGESKASLG